MRPWVRAMALATVGCLAVAAAGADPEPRLSLQVLQDTSPLRRAAGSALRFVFAAPDLEANPERWPPRLVPPSVPSKDPATAPFRARLAQALASNDRATALKACQGLLQGATDIQAHYVWWQIAALQDRPALREQALRRVIATVPKGTLAPELRASLDAARVALLETLDWHGNHDARLQLAAEILAESPASGPAPQALSHAHDALLAGARAKTVPVPVSVVLELAEKLTTLAEYSADGPPRRALELLGRHGDAPTRMLAADQMAKLKRMQRESTPGQFVSMDPNEALHSQLFVLFRDCAVLFGPIQERLEADVLPGGSRPSLRVTPQRGPLARCLVDRGPEYLEHVAASAHVTVPWGADAALAAQMVTKSFVIVGTSPSLKAAQQRLAVVQRRLGLHAVREDVDPKADPVLSRGRYDDGVYLSIEASSVYRELQPGYYIVVAGSAAQHSPQLAALLDQAKRAGIAAYQRELQVYMGCMH